MIDGDCLAAFVAIVEERSFSRAADRLGIAQSVVSKRLRRLEDQLGVELVDRSRRADIRPTRVGRLFLPQAIDTLARLDLTERAGRNLGRGSSGPLRIGYVFSAAMNGTVAAILSGLRTGFPELELQPRLMETPEQLTALEAGHLDMALVRPRPSYPPGCMATTVHSETLVVCLSSGHHLAETGEVNSAQLSEECFIVPQFHEEVGLIDNIRHLAKIGRFATPKIIRTDDFVTAACLAAAGVGVVLAPASLANLKLGGIAFRNLADFGECLDTVLVCRSDAPERAVDHVLAQLSRTHSVQVAPVSGGR